MVISLDKLIVDYWVRLFFLLISYISSITRKVLYNYFFLILV